MGFLDADLLAGIVERSIDAAAALAHYRGGAGLVAPEIQAVDREVLGEVG